MRSVLGEVERMSRSAKAPVSPTAAVARLGKSKSVLSVPSVSVIIPAYNRAKTIRAAIESVLRQTYGDFELLVVDDGSSDGTLAVAAGLADQRIRLVANPRNMGAGGARNTGISQARGQWVAFQDSDDEWLPAKLEKQMARLTAPDTGYIASYCGLLTLGGLDDEQGRRGQPHYTPGPAIAPTDGDIFASLLRSSFVSTQTLVARRDMVETIGGFDGMLKAIEDWDFALRLAQRGPFAFVDEPLVLQRFSPNSITRNSKGILTAQRQIVDKHESLFVTNPELLAQHYYMLAGGCRQQGDLGEAQNYLGKARRLRPADPRIWAMTLLVAAHRLRGGGKAA